MDAALTRRSGWPAQVFFLSGQNRLAPDALSVASTTMLDLGANFKQGDRDRNFLVNFTKIFDKIYIYRSITTSFGRGWDEEGVRLWRATECQLCLYFVIITIGLVKFRGYSSRIGIS
jgi:hypothetical protein